MPVLRVSNLSKTFSTGFWPFTKIKKYRSVDDISFFVDKGEIVGFLGPNGAGKTTTIQMLLGTLTPSNGSIYYFGFDFDKHRVDLLKKIGYASGYDKLPALLTVLESLDIVGRIYGMTYAKRIEQIQKLLKFFGIWELRNALNGSLSAGQATRVMLVKAFIANPEIVLLDEPTASLDPDIAYEVRQFILEQRQEPNNSILITSHNMDEVTELCDRVLVLKNGIIIENSTPKMLAQSISKVYVHLMIASDLNDFFIFLKEASLMYTNKDSLVTIEIDEQNVAQFLADLGKRQIMYSQISIDKPTLEDYFLSIAKTKVIL